MEWSDSKEENDDKACTGNEGDAGLEVTGIEWR